MLVLAHRGYHANAAENTLAAFEAAVACGVDGIETDVRLSRDDLPLLLHDRVVAGRAVSEMTRSELEAALGHPVPTLADALERFPDILWNIEIKTPKALPATLAVLRQYQDKRRLMVTSFRHDVVLACAQALPIECGLLIAQRPANLAAMLQQCEDYANLRILAWDYNILDEALLNAAVEQGWRNFVYGAQTCEEHEHCKRLGLAGLITDHPELAKDIL